MATDSTMEAATRANPLLTMSLQRPGMESHAVISHPKSYQDAVAAAYEVFDLGSKSIDRNGIHLRRSVQTLDSKTNVWARILPREWAAVVHPRLDEVAVFLKEDEVKWDNMKAAAVEKVTDGSDRSDPPKLLHLVALGYDGKRDNDRYFVVPMPRSYEECQSIAHGLMTTSLPHSYNTKQPTQLILKGTFPAVGGGDIVVKLVPSAYISYIKNLRDVVRILVDNWR